MTFRKFLIIIISIFVFESSAFGEFSISQIANKYAPSVVTIISLNENDQPLYFGSGFFINKNGDMATNHHVLAGAAKAVIKTSEGEKGEIIEIIKDDPKLDLLIAKTSLRNTIPLPLGDSDTIKTGQEVVAIGNPAGFEGAISMGTISGVRETEGIKLIQITAPILPGGSGGPVFSSSGEVIGISTAFLVLGHNLNLAMPINYLKTLEPTSLRLGFLPRMTTKLEATLIDEKSNEVFDIHYGTFVRMPKNPINYGITDSDDGPAYRGEYNNRYYAQSVAPPGMVYFKNGKKLFCDRAWKDGNTVFLVIHGKNLAVGYNESEIDMKKSFNLS